MHIVPSKGKKTQHNVAIMPAQEEKKPSAYFALFFIECSSPMIKTGSIFGKTALSGSSGCRTVWYCYRRCFCLLWRKTVLKMSLSLGFDHSAVARLTLPGMFLLPPSARRINGAVTTRLSVSSVTDGSLLTTTVRFQNRLFGNENTGMS